MRAPRNREQPIPTPRLSARLAPAVRLETKLEREIVAYFDYGSINLGEFSPSGLERARELHTGLPLTTLSAGDPAGEEMDLLVRRLARYGLLEYRLGPSLDREADVLIEPQVPDYWPQSPQLDPADVVVLSRFAYMRRRANDMVLESPLAGGLFKIGNPRVVAQIATLASPQKVAVFCEHDVLPMMELLGLLLNAQIIFRIDKSRGDGLRPSEGDEHLVLWDFHDLLFHARSTEGRHANPLGGRYPFVGVLRPPSAVRAPWPGKKIDLRHFLEGQSEPVSPARSLLRARHSTRSFDQENPIRLAELSHFLDSTARVQSRWRSKIDIVEDGPMIGYTARPYPSAGASYELELYIAVHNCEGLARGVYHYDAGRHELSAIGAHPNKLDALLTAAAFAMGAPTPPNILITMAARFGRVSWKYSSVAYELILKNVGVLTQTLYLITTEMGLGGCAIGSANIDLFQKMTGIEFHVEGAVGQFALGRSAH